MLLAELEAETLGLESALARIDEALSLARQVETRSNLPFTHLLRGRLLLERDPSYPAPAEEAFQTAAEIAKEQGARSPRLQAALALAKMFRLKTTIGRTQSRTQQDNRRSVRTPAGGNCADVRT